MKLVMTLEEYLAFHKKSKEKSCDLVTYLYYLMDKYDFDAPTLYNKANISKQLYSAIISGKTNPSLNTLLKIVFAMKLTNHECKYLLKKGSFTLASSSIYSLITRYCLENKIYELHKVNDLLASYGYKNKIIE